MLAGFGRTYYVKGVFGTPPLPSALVHLHGLVMTAWVVLFIVQIQFISSKRIRLHQRLGYAGIGLLMFALLFGAAIYYRRRAAAHKSLMLLTAVNFLPPAVARTPVAPLQAFGPLWFFGFPSALALLSRSGRAATGSREQSVPGWHGLVNLLLRCQAHVHDNRHLDESGDMGHAFRLKPCIATGGGL